MERRGRIHALPPPSSSGLGRSPLKAETGVRFPLGAPTRTHPEPQSVPVEQFLAMLRFEQREKVTELICEAELLIDLNRSGRDDCF